MIIKKQYIHMSTVNKMLVVSISFTGSSRLFPQIYYDRYGQSKPHSEYYTMK